MQTQIDPELTALSSRIAYITINPGGKFIKSAQVGFAEAGLEPAHLVIVGKKERLQKEFRKYRFSMLGRFLLPKVKQYFGNQKSFSNETVNISVPNRHFTPMLNHPATIRIIGENNIKYLVNCGAGIFRKSLVELPGLFIINAHAGKLPEYQNMNVVEWAVYNGDEVTGSVHLIDTGIDTGKILWEEPIVTSGCLNYVEARERAFDKVIKMVGKVVLAHHRGEIIARDQEKGAGKKWYAMHSFFHRRVNAILLNAAQKEHHAATLPSS